MSKRDDINQLYDQSKKVNNICTALFWANVVISLILLFSSVPATSYLVITLAVISFLFMVLKVIDDGILWYKAESMRRKNSIQEAYKVKLDNYSTLEYYNNSMSDPESSYICNTFESIYFTKEIAERMQLKAVIKSIVSVIIMIIACRFITDDNLLLIIFQTGFSTFVIEDSIRLIIFVYRIKNLYAMAYNELVTVGVSNDRQRIWLKYFCTEYESIKAHYRIRLDESLFKKLNATLSSEWKTMLGEIKL